MAVNVCQGRAIDKITKSKIKSQISKTQIKDKKQGGTMTGDGGFFLDNHRRV